MTACHTLAALWEEFSICVRIELKVKNKYGNLHESDKRDDMRCVEDKLRFNSQDGSERISKLESKKSYILFVTYKNRHNGGMEQKESQVNTGSVSFGTKSTESRMENVLTRKGRKNVPILGC